MINRVIKHEIKCYSFYFITILTYFITNCLKNDIFIDGTLKLYPY